MSVPAVIKERYRVGPRVGQGGMGDVYRAYDMVLETDAAIKVLGANSSKQALDLFDREWRALRDLHHGSIVSIYDRGEFREGSVTRPYFVMPFLNGRTLYDQIRDPQVRFSVAEIVSIMTKVCEGIAAAHSRGIIHRDIKPGNIFVLEGGAVQVIDFGVAHLSDDTTLTTLKGTTPYIAPELLDPDDRRQPSAKTDLFSLAVVCYEALTRIQPFERDTAKDTIRAILREIPKPACDCNPEVSVGLSQVLQKGMAKSDISRYASVAEFADKLQRAFRNEPLPEFNRATIEPRLRAITDLMARGKVDSANSMLRSIESEGYSDASISAMRLRIEKALERRSVEHLFETVNSQREAGQYLDALSTLDKALQSMPDNVDAASLKAQIESEWVQSCIANAHHSSVQRDFDRARKLLQDVQKIRPRDTQVLEMLAAVSRAEENDANLRREKESLYQEAQKAYRDGEICSALEKLERIVALQNQWNAPASDRDTLYLQFLREVKTEQERINSAFREIQTHVAGHKYSQALAVCDQMLVTNPGHPLFTAARLDIDNRDRQVRLDYIAEVCSRSEAIADLEARVGLLHEALAKYQTESQLQELLRNAKSKRDLINSAIAYARKTEQRGEYAEAIERWKLVRQFHPNQPGVDEELERVKRRHDDQLRSEHKQVALRRIDQLLEDAAYEEARQGCDSLLKEYPGDKQVLSRLDLARECAVHAREADSLLVAAQAMIQQKRWDEAIQSLRRAYELDGRREAIRQNLSAALLEKVRLMSPEEWESADPLVREAIRVQPNDTAARSLATVIGDRKERALVDNACLTVLKLSNNPQAALEVIDQVLATYPANARLLEQRENILKSLGRDERALAATAGGRSVKEIVSPVPEPAPANVNSNSAPSGLTHVLENETLVSVEPDDAVESSPARSGPDSLRTQALLKTRLADSAGAVAAWLRALVGPAFTRTRAGASTLREQWAALIEKFRIPIQPQAALEGTAAFVAVSLMLFIGAPHVKKTAAAKTTIPETVIAPPAQISATITVTPPPSELLIDRKPVSPQSMPVAVTAGTREIEARRPGYKASTTHHDFQQSSSLAMTLEALPTRLRFVAPDSNLQLKIDGEERAANEGREFGAIDLTPGEHELEYTSSRGSGKFDIKAENGAAPVVSAWPAAKASAILIATTYHGVVSVRATLPEAKLTIDGQPAGQLTGGALELPSSAGVHQLAVEGDTGSTLSISVTDQPQVFAWMWWLQSKPPLDVRYQQAANAAAAARYSEALSRLNGILAENPRHEPSRQLREQVLKMIEIAKQVQGRQ